MAPRHPFRSIRYANNGPITAAPIPEPEAIIPTAMARRPSNHCTMLVTAQSTAHSHPIPVKDLGHRLRTNSNCGILRYGYTMED
ncbi:hypothetical protein RvY_04331 [Ramazzottius varieornatus]|uniref:Uncharacterized protein n=1 Tax=Ramazzottius varieornatus TaxID=947166 RepID=A0A1D1UR99_RAMVA|nr:hypothetical protein RvY_04331 [Ramazzottius varieornatus]